ncbi:hypothetical protein G9P44_003779 [Scheffersomyces stipitis]|nr:hypothetical protein G9P44_003779 [Scheffersomyces stipitis]
MTRCLHDLAEVLDSSADEKLESTKLFDLHSLTEGGSPTTNTSNSSGQQLTSEAIYKLPAANEMLASKRPWKTNPNYFTHTKISALALMKMTIHAQRGGSIEVMGMLTGKITHKTIIVMDVYPLPVEGTETRVNAQAEGYEYMVQYLEANKKIGRHENIVGWYHSHPGYGCWLSGIDVSTQELNQNFQDPYLALVIDPIKTLKQNKVEIGAFRTYSEEYVNNRDNNSNSGSNSKKKKERGGSNDSRSVPKSKRKDFGVHSERYYSLDIDIFNSELDSKIISMLLNYEDNNSLSWVHGLITKGVDNGHGSHDKELPLAKVGGLIQNIDIQDEGLDKIFQLVEQLQKCEVNSINRYDAAYIQKFRSSFEHEMQHKLLERKVSRTKQHNAEEIVEDEDMDESDLEDLNDRYNGREVSDIDDILSMESNSVTNRNDVIEEEEEEEDEEGEEGAEEAENESNEGVESTAAFGESEPLTLNLQIRQERWKARGKLIDDADEDAEGERTPTRRKHLRTKFRGSPLRQSLGRRAINITPWNQDQLGLGRNDNLIFYQNYQNRAGPPTQTVTDEHGMKLKKMANSRSLATASTLAKKIGQKDVQDLVTLDVQQRLFL